MADPIPRLRGETTSALEKGFASVVTPFQQFISDQKTASMLLLVCTLIALVVANSPLAREYDTLVEMPLGFVLGGSDYAMSLRHWVNDGLMALFFFVLGLEIKRELLVGELRAPGRSLPVLAAAAGGMAVPALLFYAINQGGDAIQGWAIPMATDTAFAIGILALLGARAPAGLTTFLLALAIIDDMGAVLVIALFYSDAISVVHLLGAAGLLAALLLMNLAGVRHPVVYFVGGGMVWLAMLGSGVHATLAGILVAMTIPARPARSTRAFVRRSRQLLDEFEAIEERDEAASPILAEPEKHHVVERLQETAVQATTPLQLWERALEHPVALFVLPLFALVNAGIAVQPAALPALLADPLSLGIVLGLVAGKTIGISLATFAVLWLGRGRLPAGMQPRHVVGLGLLGGMGFTMSIFIAGLGFSNQPEQLLIAKTGILTASLIAGVGGYLWLRFAAPLSR
ncbi:Na+/H+ antiporter NhaA [Thiogranum longum]